MISLQKETKNEALNLRNNTTIPSSKWSFTYPKDVFWIIEENDQIF